jgi:2-haloacid dehalogenase
MPKKVTEEEIKETLSVIKSSLQTYPDVIKGLQLLKENGFRLITLTNSPQCFKREQLKKESNLTDYFEQALSIDTIENTKPAETYLWQQKN